MNCCAVFAISLERLGENAILAPCLKGPSGLRLCVASSIATAFLFASLNSVSSASLNTLRQNTGFETSCGFPLKRAALPSCCFIGI